MTPLTFEAVVEALDMRMACSTGSGLGIFWERPLKRLRSILIPSLPIRLNEPLSGSPD